MNAPLTRDRSSLSRADFELCPIWVRVQDYDEGQPWFPASDDQTYRPWHGPFPLQPKSQFPLVELAGEFRLHDGSSFQGHFQPVTREWDEPLPARKMRDGRLTEPKRWSDRRCGSPLSVLALHSPVVFVGEHAFDLHLRRDPETRKRCINEFFTAIGKPPSEVFPIEFSGDPNLFDGVVRGNLGGFYSFPLDKPFEIDRGDQYLSDQD